MCDVKLARKFISKKANADERGIEFKLSFLSFKNMMKAKKCYFTGLPLVDGNRSIDRVDNKKGYVKGNVVACHQTVNCLKGMIEDGTNALTMQNVGKMLKKWESRL